MENLRKCCLQRYNARFRVFDSREILRPYIPHSELAPANDYVCDVGLRAHNTVTYTIRIRGRRTIRRLKCAALPFDGALISPPPIP